MAAYVYNCLDCGGTATAGRKDAKYCPSCRLLRGLLAVRAKFKYNPKCKGCGQRFYARHVRDTRQCGDCESRQHSPTASIACPICKATGTPTDGVPVCLNCAKGENQPRVVKALRKGQRQRSTDNAALLTAIAGGQSHITRIEEVPVAH